MMVKLYNKNFRTDVKKVMTEERVFNMIFTLVLGTLAGWSIADAYIIRSNYIPKTEQVQQGYIAPDRLEIKCEDFDKDGKPETIMKVDDKPYSLREVNGMPVLSSYDIKLAEIQYKTK